VSLPERGDRHAIDPIPPPSCRAVYSAPSGVTNIPGVLALAATLFRLVSTA
jgi:hypothetical protein